MSLKFNSKYSESIVSPADIEAIAPKAVKAMDTLMSKTGEGNDFLGWIDLPTNYDKEEFDRIKKSAEYIKKNADVLIVIGIGGSYLGARAVIEAVKSYNYNLLAKDTPQIYFIGNSISPSSLNEIVSLCDGKDVCVNVISKSGTTTEPAIAFRVFRELINSRYSKEEAAKRIFCTTDANKGTLKELADKEGYETFVVPDDVGGRFSVLTAVGLLPIAVAGIDIDELMLGARSAQNELCDTDIEKNAALKYAAVRNCFYNKGKKMECFVSYEPNMTMFNEWLKQLFGESEGKDGKGLFPVSCVFSTDLHSLGQYIQESGADKMFETVVKFNNCLNDYVIDEQEGNIDGLNFLAGEKMSIVNDKARLGTLLAHTEGGVGNLIIEADKLGAEEIGYLIYFFEKACAISGYILGVNPFNQPGVESYKKNMFALLGKPGYEGEKEKLEKQLDL
ncbi:MAG: glucose-6-phosphate isomerase [Eubacterium coprostanoligenes]|uniref:glucose-6-phosphate isomerase n=1 Tax=Eubacterium coprostanoligenes TaxID=290054 RepID=UPI00240A2BAB|nr:glucose-6-phosphate isomerase [Eubacterium coprostanoligenes]MDD6665271.1 glucose-6-phosphate isomerase [Eubacterium coprostanoligenes]